MSNSIYSIYKTDELITTPSEWEYIKCKDCGEKLVTKEITEYEEVKTCPRCGEKQILIKKIRKNQIRSL